MRRPSWLSKDIYYRAKHGSMTVEDFHRLTEEAGAAYDNAGWIKRKGIVRFITKLEILLHKGQLMRRDRNK